MTALSTGFSARIAAKPQSASSLAFTSPRLTRSASPSASWLAYSCRFIVFSPRRGQSSKSSGFLESESRIAREHRIRLSITHAANKVRLDSCARKKGPVHGGVVEARHGPAVQAERPGGNDQIGALK